MRQELTFRLTVIVDVDGAEIGDDRLSEEVSQAIQESFPHVLLDSDDLDVQVFMVESLMERA